MLARFHIDRNDRSGHRTHHSLGSVDFLGRRHELLVLELILVVNEGFHFASRVVEVKFDVVCLIEHLNGRLAVIRLGQSQKCVVLKINVSHGKVVLFIGFKVSHSEDRRRSSINTFDLHITISLLSLANNGHIDH